MIKIAIMNTIENNTGADDYDSPWKEGMDLYFKELMQFFFPDIAREIAWDKGYQFLDKELQQVVLKGNQRQPTGKIHLEMDHYQGTL